MSTIKARLRKLEQIKLTECNLAERILKARMRVIESPTQTIMEITELTNSKERKLMEQIIAAKQRVNLPLKA